MTSLSGLPLPRDGRAGIRPVATTGGHRDRSATDRDTGFDTELAGFTLARLAVATVALLLICQVLALPSGLGWALLAAGTTVALLPCARWTTAFAGAGVVWLLGTGFWTNRFGTLSFGPTDRLALAVTVTAAVAAMGPCRWVRDTASATRGA